MTSTQKPNSVATVIMAAGHSKRMKSALPKVLHAILGKRLIEYSLEAVEALSPAKPVVVIGQAAEQVRQVVGERARFALQAQQLGTADAVKAARPLLEGEAELVVVISADMPLIRAETLQRVVASQRNSENLMTLVSVRAADPRGFGRVLRGMGDRALAVVEEKAATVQQREIDELNTSIYCFKAAWLWSALERVPLSAVGEYYLTDLVEMAAKEGGAGILQLEDEEEVIGINNRVHLAQAQQALQKRVNTALMLSGVTLVDPLRVYVDAGVQVGQDTVLYPETHLRGNSVIGSNCRIGPSVIMEDSRVGDDCRILFSVLEGALVEDHVEMGPYAHLRKGAHLASHVHMGNFGEVKNSTLGEGTKMGHFSYLGDATIGEDVNIGAGTITCNFDGQNKHATEIGKGAFIGSDTMLVAPVKIGAGAKTGAGSVVTHDVPPGSVVVGVPARELAKHKPD